MVLANQQEDIINTTATRRYTCSYLSRSSVVKCGLQSTTESYVQCQPRCLLNHSDTGSNSGTSIEPVIETIVCSYVLALRVCIDPPGPARPKYVSAANVTLQFAVEFQAKTAGH